MGEKQQWLNIDPWLLPRPPTAACKALISCGGLALRQRPQRRHCLPPVLRYPGKEVAFHGGPRVLKQ